MAATKDIVTCNQSVHQCLKDEKILHAYHPKKNRDWPQANRDIFTLLENNNNFQTTPELPEMFDTWSHWLVSEINKIDQIAEDISSVCRDRENTILIVKHALQGEEFTTMQQALLCHHEKTISSIIDWDIFDA